MKKITSFQYNTFMWFLIRSSFLELTLMQIINKAKEDSWLSIILGSLLGLILLLILEKIKNKYPKNTFISLNNKFTNITIIILSLTVNVSTLWILNHFTNSLFLYKTNLWIIGLAIIIPIIYTSSKDIHIIAKVSEILFLICIIITIINVIGLISEVNINNLKPFFKQNIFIYSLLFTMINTSKIFYLGIIPKDIIKNYSYKKNILFYLITCLNLLNITIFIICTFGIDITLLYEYPAFQILKRVNILGVLDRLESILSIEAILSLFMDLTITTYFIRETVKTTFNLNKKTDKYISLFICILSYITSNIIFKMSKSGNFFLTKILFYIGILITLIMLFKIIKNPKIVKE